MIEWVIYRVDMEGVTLPADFRYVPADKREEVHRMEAPNRRMVYRWAAGRYDFPVVVISALCADTERPYIRG